MTSPRNSLVLLVLGLATTVAMTALAANLRIVNEGDVAADWRPAGGKPLAMATYPAAATDRSQDVCINLGYQISLDGATSQFSVIRAWSSATPGEEASFESVKPYVQSAAAAVSQWKFEPTERASSNREMYSSVAMSFLGTGGTAAEVVRGHCAVDDLRSYIDKEKIAAYRRGSLAKDKLDRYRRDNNQMQ